MVGVPDCRSVLTERPLPSFYRERRTGCGIQFLGVRVPPTANCPLAGEADAGARTIRVSDITTTAAARFCESVESGHSDQDQSAQIAADLGITEEPVRVDSQAKYAIVAQGEAQIYLRLPTRKDYQEKIWDHAAGLIVVEEAGGRITDIRGDDLDFGHGRTLVNNSGVIGTNGPIHDAVLAAVARFVDLH